MNFTKKIMLLYAVLLSPFVTFAGPMELYLQNYQEKTQLLAGKTAITQFWFTQLLDHQNPEQGSFAQRYYIDEAYGPEPDAPVFFYICGESNCSSRALNGAIRVHAKTHHAKMVALEHRYYGESIPFSSLSTANLRFLTTDAALSDLAYFQKQLSQEKHWTGTWIAFGGSYPGSLSAYYRLKYPSLVAGSLASSAPVMAKEDFFEYDTHVTTVAGSQCAAAMREVVAQVEGTLNNAEQLLQMKALFDATAVKDPIDFLYLIADTGAAAIQYGMRDQFCTALTTSQTPLIGYANFAKLLYQRMGVSVVEITAQGAMSENPADYKKGVGMRQWYYQSCKEYGYWQNANPVAAQSTRSALIDLAYHRKVCERLFGLTEPANTYSLNNSYYFPLMDEQVTRIFFTNGANDPWSTLSLAEKNGNAVNSQLTYQLIEGAAHCDDLRTPKENDSQALVKARSTMDELLQSWLKSRSK